MKEYLAEYFQGPTTCCPRTTVVKSIRSEIKQSRSLSGADIRLATAMGLITADSMNQAGFNDGIIFPMDTAAAAGGPPHKIMSSLSAPGGGGGGGPRTMHALALLVDFNDNVGHRPKADFEKLLFDTTNPGSMVNYYSKLSGGQLTLTGEVTDWKRAPKPYSYYTNGQSGMGNTFPQNTPGLLQDALTQFCQTDSLARFDLDGDGFVDGIFLIHAGAGAETISDKQKRKDMIWSHKWVLPTPFLNNGVKVFAYSTEPEDGRVGVFAHEFGHVLGLPDLYDTTYRSEGVGEWCLMGAGSWAGGGDTPCRMSPWCLNQLGWIRRPTNVTQAQTLTIPTLEVDPAACYRIWTGGAASQEYFLIENRQQTGLDAGLPGHGLAIWHIDERRSDNDAPPMYKVGLVQADGQQDLEFATNRGDANDLFPGPRPVRKVSDRTAPTLRAYGGNPTGLLISSITESAGTIKLKVRV